MTSSLKKAIDAVPPGRHEVIQIPLPSFYECLPVNTTVHVFRGKKEGPTLAVTAAIHGDEVNGVQIARTILRVKGLKRLKGTLLVLPVVNTYSFLLQSRYLMDRRDLNRQFPGSAKGSLASRLAHTLIKEVLADVDVLIDLHSGSLHRTNLPQIRVSSEDENTMLLARVFNAPLILLAKEREGSLRAALNGGKAIALLYEAGEAHRLDPVASRVGVRGIINVLQHLGMLPTRVKRDFIAQSTSSVARSSYWIRAPISGLFRSSKKPGSQVTAGEEIGSIGNPLAVEEEKIQAPISGTVIGLNQHPLVVEGSSLFNIGCLDEPEIIEGEIRKIRESYESDCPIDTRLHPEDVWS